MKVAIIGQTLNKNHADKISGGIQTVERLHVKIFLQEGWDVFFIAPSDSEAFSDHSNFYLRLLQTPSEEFYKDKTLTKHEKGALNKQKAVDMGDLVREIEPDLIINHSFSSSHVRLCSELSRTYPILNFVHNTPDTAMDIGLIAKLQFYLKMVKNGSNLVCVSGYQRDLWRQAINKRLDSESKHFSFITRSEIDQVYDPYCYPIFVSEVTTESRVNDRFIVITRPDPIKNLHKLLELMDSGAVDKFALDIFIAHPGSLLDSEYFVEKITQRIQSLTTKGWDVVIHHNASREYLLQQLSAARGCFIPCTVEAAPVALLEAGSYGVSSIVFGKKRDGTLGHAAVDLLGMENIQLVDVSTNAQEAASALQKAVKMISADAVSRQKLHEHTQKIHSFSQRIEDIMALVTNVKQRYTKTKQRLMEF